MDDSKREGLVFAARGAGTANAFLAHQDTVASWLSGRWGMRTHLLVVDDDESIRTTLAAILQRDGHDVASAAGGKEALDRMRDDPPDLVLLDLMMPGMGGWEVIAAMRENPRLAEIPVVVLTSLHDDAHAPPGQPVLHKPVDDGIVCGVVDSLLVQKRGLALALQEPPSALLPRHAPR